MKLIGFGVIVLVFALAGVTRRFWLLVGAAVLAALSGWALIENAMEWWNGPPDCGPSCWPGNPPPLGSGWELAAAFGSFALAAVFACVAVRVRRRGALPTSVVR